MKPDVTKYFVRYTQSLREVINCIDKNQSGAALVVDEESRLLDIITDGDIRRAMLAGIQLDAPLSQLRDRRSRAGAMYPKPVSAPRTASRAQLLEFMRKHGVNQLPLLDEKKRVVELVLLVDLGPKTDLPLQALIMAGGQGNRLRPLTDKTPKPMLPMGDKPLLQVIFEQLRLSGIKHVNVSTHYKGDQITKHFGDGQKFGLDIQYLQENQPLGTAGALSLMESKEPILIMNGDIVTQVNFRAMLDFHNQNKADMTVAIRSYELRVPYGIVETDGIQVRAISEKPVLKHFINAGMYLINPAMSRLVPKDQSFDMTDLIKRVIEKGHKVVSFPLHEHWIDIGQIADYELAQKTFQKTPKKR